MKHPKCLSEHQEENYLHTEEVVSSANLSVEIANDLSKSTSSGALTQGDSREISRWTDFGEARIESAQKIARYNSILCFTFNFPPHFFSPTQTLFFCDDYTTGMDGVRDHSKMITEFRAPHNGLRLKGCSDLRDDDYLKRYVIVYNSPEFIHPKRS
ncbi:hypothetical protein RRG08_043109 [Elysia crispata]|uniref:Uncharacterized protein n=1 Tax=Elysia crispata TaxID=231223 RepID=A0AAE1CP78_9GAST|nr:hypothetical protein RRG08_043109 [Elysia crispata]